jgi:biopolymer transport protein ExbD
MANPRLARQARRARSGSTEVKLNITSMMDMFTIILVFLLKSFSTQGQLITPAAGLVLPTSTIERTTDEALCVKISHTVVAVENRIVVDEQRYRQLLEQDDFLIQELLDVLSKYAEEGRKASEMFGKEFSGEITIQGNVDVPYKVLTRVMYTCGQAGYPVMNLIVYKKE